MSFLSSADEPTTSSSHKKKSTPASNKNKPRRSPSKNLETRIAYESPLLQSLDEAVGLGKLGAESSRTEPKLHDDGSKQTPKTNKLTKEVEDLIRSSIFLNTDPEPPGPKFPPPPSPSRNNPPPPRIRSTPHRKVTEKVIKLTEATAMAHLCHDEVHKFLHDEESSKLSQQETQFVLAWRDGICHRMDNDLHAAVLTHNHVVQQRRVLEFSQSQLRQDVIRLKSQIRKANAEINECQQRIQAQIQENAERRTASSLLDTLDRLRRK